MKHGPEVPTERRRNFRAPGRGAAVVHGPIALRGEIENLSLGGALVRCAPGPAPVPCRGTLLWVELELGDRWVAQRARARRADIGELALAFDRVEPDVEDLIEDHVLATVEASATPRVVVLDPSGPRRRRVCEALRRAGWASFEAATPLEAIHRVETSPGAVAAVAVAEQVARTASAALVDYFAESNPHIKIAVLADGTGPRRRIPLCEVAIVCGEDGVDDDTLTEVLGAALVPR